MNYKTIKELEKRRLKLYKQITELERKMESCPTKELCTIKFDYSVSYRKLIIIEGILKYRCLEIKNELNYIKPINYKKIVKTK